MAGPRRPLLRSSPPTVRWQPVPRTKPPEAILSSASVSQVRDALRQSGSILGAISQTYRIAEVLVQPDAHGGCADSFFWGVPPTPDPEVPNPCPDHFAQKRIFATPGQFTWTVPEGVTSIDVKLWGAGGGAGFAPNGSDATADAIGAGGAGGYARASVAVRPGEQLLVSVGMGGQPGMTLGCGGGGGGASGIVANLTDVIAVAGGGGGASPVEHGGAGGGMAGEAGDGMMLANGAGGTEFSGGMGGLGGLPGSFGVVGSGGAGGADAAATFSFGGSGWGQGGNGGCALTTMGTKTEYSTCSGGVCASCSNLWQGCIRTAHRRRRGGTQRSITMAEHHWRRGVTPCVTCGPPPPPPRMPLRAERIGRAQRKLGMRKGTNKGR